MAFQIVWYQPNRNIGAYLQDLIPTGTPQGATILGTWELGSQAEKPHEIKADANGLKMTQISRIIKAQKQRRLQIYLF